MTAPPGRRPLRLAIVNDFEVVVAGVAQMLVGHADRVVVVELDSRLPVAEEVDLVLFDTFAAVTGDGVDLADLVEGHARVVVYSWTLHPGAVATAMAQGAAGYLSKGLGADELVEALEAIHCGEQVVMDVQDQPEHQGEQGWPGRAEGLSRREAEVLARIARGQSNQEIADELYLSINSIKSYVRSAYAKIGSTRRAHAVVWALTHGFAPLAHREADPDTPESPDPPDPVESPSE